jgi:hypothetical protein
MKTMDDRPQTVDGRLPSAFRLLLFVRHFFLLSSFLLASCATPTPTVPAETITAYATASAQPWMDDLFTCANEQNILVEITAETPDIFLRIGEPEILVQSAYQIGEEEILVMVNRESPIQNLTLPEVQGLFAGRGDAAVWVYASGVDSQWVFDQAVMEGRSVTSFARVAASPQVMSDTLNSDPSAIGILPKHWAAGNLRVVYSVGLFPVLAITNGEPQGAVRAVLGCLHSK